MDKTTIEAIEEVRFMQRLWNELKDKDKPKNPRGDEMQQWAMQRLKALGYTLEASWPLMGNGYITATKDGHTIKEPFRQDLQVSYTIAVVVLYKRITSPKRQGVA